MFTFHEVMAAYIWKWNSS